VSQENVEALTRGLEAFNKGSPQVFLDMYDPDIVLRVEYGIPTGTFLGAEAVEQWFDDFYAAFARGFHFEFSELIVSGDSVVVIARNTGIGRTSKVRVERTFASVFTFRAGRIIRIDLAGTRQQALRAVGLAE
jgi:ketosteroid isomerase-like protein